jgi:outer membrane protein OmpA-like peptidoglycan-associated protein
MRVTSTLAVAASLLLAGTAMAFAQPLDSGVDTGLEVQVNPLAAGGKVLLYPGGDFARVVPPLLYPGQGYRGPVSASRRVASRPAAPRPATPKPTPAPQVASAAPPPASSNANPGGYVPSLFNSPSLSLTPQTPPPKPQQQAAKPAPAPSSGGGNLTKRSVILFAKDASDPAEAALGAIKFLAGDLNGAMTTPSARIELQAFGGAKGDKGSDARRLSLKRALAIRQVLIDDGVSPDRIDVRAMGGADDSGPTDRVDVYVKA